MMWNKLMPLMVLAGIGIHSRKAIEQKILHFQDGQKAVICRYNMNMILRAAIYETALGDSPNLANFTQFIRANMRKKTEDDDPTLDPWGTPYEHALEVQLLTLVSAGPDKQMKTADDIVVQSTLGY